MLNNNKTTIKVFVDAEVLILSHFSGIGHYTASLLKAVDDLLELDEYSHIKMTLGVPRSSKHSLNRYEFSNFAIRLLPFSPHKTNGLKSKHMLPPIDLLFGKQIYIFPNYSSWPTLFSKSIPVIYDLSFIKYPQFGDTRNMEFLVDQVNRSVMQSARIITISTNSKTEIQKQYKYDNSKIDIIYPIIDTKKFYRRSDLEISEVKAKYAIFDEYILFVGNLEPRKNLISLLEAYELLPKELQNKYSLLLVGAKGWKDSDIHKKIQRMRMNGLRVVQPVDYVVDEDIPALASGASIFAYVSIYEGFGIPPVEAMACGTPVVVSNNSSLPEACGNAAIYVKAEDTNAIASALTQSINSRAINPETGYEQAAKFDAKQTALEFIKSIEKAAKQ
jgi:glycosyltransferase involved in cell wall biosynthesis